MGEPAFARPKIGQKIPEGFISCEVFKHSDPRLDGHNLLPTKRQRSWKSVLMPLLGKIELVLS